MSQDQICQKHHCSSVISSLNVNTRALQQLWCFYSNAVFPSVQWSTLVRTCQQRSWRCTILISSVTSETGEQILTRESRARVSKAVSGIKGEAATETRESCWGKIPTQPHWATEVTVWMCVCVWETSSFSSWKAHSAGYSCFVIFLFQIPQIQHSENQIQRHLPSINRCHDAAGGAAHLRSGTFPAVCCLLIRRQGRTCPIAWECFDFEQLSCRSMCCISVKLLCVKKPPQSYAFDLYCGGSEPYTSCPDSVSG